MFLNEIRWKLVDCNQRSFHITVKITRQDLYGNFANGIGRRFSQRLAEIQCSALPLITEVTSLIRKETKNEHRTSNIERRMGRDEKDMLLLYSVWIIMIVEQVLNNRTGSHIAWQLLKSRISSYSKFKTVLCFFHSMLDVGCSMFNVHLGFQL